MSLDECPIVSELRFLKRTVGLKWNDISKILNVTRVTLWRWRKRFGWNEEDVGK